MNPETSTPSDIDAYLDTLSTAEREEVEGASVALDIAGLAFRARSHRHLTQIEAAQETGLKQQSISRIEGGSVNVTIRTLEKYLRSLRLTLALSVIDEDTGECLDQITINRPDTCNTRHAVAVASAKSNA